MGYGVYNQASLVSIWSEISKVSCEIWVDIIGTQCVPHLLSSQKGDNQAPSLPAICDIGICACTNSALDCLRQRHIGRGLSKWISQIWKVFSSLSIACIKDVTKRIILIPFMMVLLKIFLWPSKFEVWRNLAHRNTLSEGKIWYVDGFDTTITK